MCVVVGFRVSEEDPKLPIKTAFDVLAILSQMPWLVLKFKMFFLGIRMSL